MHATNSYSLEHSSINNSIYTSSVQLNAHMHSEPTNQVRVSVSMCNRAQKQSIFVWLGMCVSVKCVRGAWCTLTMHSTRNACILYFIITIKSGSWIMSETDLVIYYVFVAFMCIGCMKITCVSFKNNKQLFCFKSNRRNFSYLKVWSYSVFLF